MHHGLIPKYPAEIFRSGEITMSLLTSLLQASTRFQQAMDNRAPRTDAPASKTNEGAAAGEPQSSTDDRFTPSQWQDRNPASQKTRQLPLTQYKQTVAQDLSYVRETLRHKLAEYNVHPATALSVSKNEQGSIQLDGKIPDQVREIGRASCREREEKAIVGVA